MCFGHETGESGTPHLQGYCETTQRLGLRAMKNLLGSRAHIEKAIGTSQQNLGYCTKEDPMAFIIGTPMSQGTRTDLETIKSELDTGVSLESIANNHFSKWVIYRKAFSEYVSMKQPVRAWKTKVVCLWGVTGTGKTRFAYDQVMDLQVWSPGDFQWFDGYCGQEIVIIDDYRGEYPLPLFLKLTDRYPMRVPVKGGFTNWCPKKIYITSNEDPDSWYPDVSGCSFQAFKRRFDSIEYIKDPIYPDIALL